MRIYFFLIVFQASCTLLYAQERYAPTPDWYSDYDVKFYRIDIEATDTTADIKGNTEVVAEIKVSGLNRFTLELAEAVQVDSVWMDGRRATFRHEGDLLYVLSPAELPVGNLCSVTVFYATTDIKGNGFFSAVNNKKDVKWDIPVTWTLSEPFNAKKWFPCKQHLPDKADSAYIFVTVPLNLKVGAPGVLSAATAMPGGKTRYEWKTRYPVAYYLLSFTVAEYQDYTIFAHPKNLEKPVAVQNYIYKRDEYLEKNKANIDTTTTLIELYSELFLPYPFADEKYGHCVAPMGGGMEHQTMTTLSEFSFLLIAHELAHQWFGDLVTCASFQDIWVNEGFASYAEYLALERMASQEKALAWLREAQAIASWSKNGSVFIPAKSAEDEWRIFNMSITYKKGALLVHNIRRIINDDHLFFEVLRGFLRQYSFSVATGMDFKKYLEEQTGIDFTLFFDQWFFGEGYPIFDISWKKDSTYIELLAEHTGSASATSSFIIDLDIRILKADGSDTSIQLPIRTTRDFFKIKIDGEVSGIEIDPDYYIMKQVHNNALVGDLPTNDRFVQCITHVKRRQNLSVTFAVPTERKCHVQLTDATGKKVFTSMTAKRKKEITIPMEQLSNTTYLLYVQNGKELFVRKIVKTAY